MGDGIATAVKEVLDSIGETVYKQCSREELLEQMQDCTVLVMELDHRIDAEVIDAASNLQYIVIPATGTDRIDCQYAESKGITILSLRGETEFLNTITPTAELALGLIIALFRKLIPAEASVREGTWDRNRFRGHSLYGKTLGIVGLGRLGKMMQTYGTALGMNIMFTSPKEKDSVPLNTLLQESDIVSLHVHLSEDTEGMIGEKELNLMKEGAILINTSRGKVVDEAAILQALEQNILAGYATDVLADELQFEQDRAESALIEYAKTHDNVIITPHIGGATVEARTATDLFIAEKLKQAIS